MLISVQPTVRFNRYFAMLSTINSDKMANKSNNMLYSVVYGFNIMLCLPGVLRYIRFRMNHGTPSDNKIANEFAPSEFDTPKPPSFLRINRTLEMPSGKQPPAAKNVRPMMASGIRNVYPKYIGMMSCHRNKTKKNLRKTIQYKIRLKVKFQGQTKRTHTHI